MMKSLILNINGCNYDEMTIPRVCGGCGALHSVEDVADGADIHELRIRSVATAVYQRCGLGTFRANRRENLRIKTANGNKYLETLVIRSDRDGENRFPSIQVRLLVQDAINHYLNERRAQVVDHEMFV